MLKKHRIFQRIKKASRKNPKVFRQPKKSGCNGFPLHPLSVAAGEGFEPSHTESESAVLPLHNPAMSRRTKTIIQVLRCLSTVFFLRGAFFCRTYGRGSGSQKIGGSEVFLQRLIQQGKYHHAQDDAGEHIAAVIEQGVKPRAGHGHAEELVGHINAPDENADEIVDQETQHAADEGAVIHAPLPAGQQARAEAQGYEGQEVVADDGGPVDGELVADEVGDGTVYQTGAGAPAAAVTGGEEDDGQHLQGHGAAVGELIELDKAQNFRHGNENSGFAKHFGFCVFHVASSNKKIPAWRAMQASQCGTNKQYARIPTPALPGSGSRDRAAIRPSQPAPASTPWIVATL